MPYEFGPRDAADFPARCAALAAKHAPAAAPGEGRWALDVGCAVGGATFELARSFDAVVGLDFSHAFIAAAKRLLVRPPFCFIMPLLFSSLCSYIRRLGARAWLRR